MKPPLRQVYEAASRIWADYCESGPGVRPGDDYETLRAAAETLRAAEALDPAVGTAVDQLLDLSRRCVLTPQGLSFVSGEAGLIARRDQHRTYEAALELLETRL